MSLCIYAHHSHTLQATYAHHSHTLQSTYTVQQNFKQAHFMQHINVNFYEHSFSFFSFPFPCLDFR